MTAAGIVTELGPGPKGLPEKSALDKNDDDLFRRSEIAAARGARLIVWNEGATVVEETGEQSFIDRGSVLPGGAA